MATNGEQAYELFSKAVGEDEGAGEWFEIDQARINAFADVTEDHQFIHVDPEQCKTLSLLTKLMSSVPQPPERLEGVVMGVNYGFEKVRFLSPVKVGSKVRATSVLASVDAKDANTLQITRAITVEIDGESKPALVAEWVTRALYG